MTGASLPCWMSRLRSTVGFSILILSPPPGPKPLPNSSMPKVGMKSGTTIASAVAAAPMAPAEDRRAPLLTPNPLGSTPSLPRGRPQRAI